MTFQFVAQLFRRLTDEVFSKQRKKFCTFFREKLFHQIASKTRHDRSRWVNTSSMIGNVSRLTTFIQLFIAFLFINCVLCGNYDCDFSQPNSKACPWIISDDYPHEITHQISNLQQTDEGKLRSDLCLSQTSTQNFHNRCTTSIEGNFQFVNKILLTLMKNTEYSSSIFIMTSFLSPQFSFWGLWAFALRRVFGVTLEALFECRHDWMVYPHLFILSIDIGTNRKSSVSRRSNLTHPDHRCRFGKEETTRPNCKSFFAGKFLLFKIARSDKKHKSEAIVGKLTSPQIIVDSASRAQDCYLTIQFKFNFDGGSIKIIRHPESGSESILMSKAGNNYRR